MPRPVFAAACCLLLAPLAAVLFAAAPARASHFRFGTVAWSAVTETYPCADGAAGPAAAGTPCYLPFTYDGRVRDACIGHNTTLPGDTEMCQNSCWYPNDGDCDDGGANSQYSLCQYGTDCGDCGPRPVASGGGFEAGPSGWCATAQAYSSSGNWGGCTTCTSTRKIRLKVHLAYRRSGVEGHSWLAEGPGSNNNAVGDTFRADANINWGDYTGAYTNPMTVSSGGLSRTWADSQGEFTHVYSQAFLDSKRSSNGGPGGFEIGLASCCRVGDLVNNAHASYRIATWVDVDALEAGQSGPESAQVPIVTVQQSSEAQSFDVPAYSAQTSVADGGLTFAWASGPEMGIGQVDPSRNRFNGDHLGMVLDTATGALSWVTEAAALGIYSAAVKVTETASGAYTLVDFIVKVVPAPPKFCSYACLAAGGLPCQEDADCALDACSAVTEAGREGSPDAQDPLYANAAGDAELVSFSLGADGTSWRQRVSGERRYRQARPPVADDACPAERLLCTPALNRRVRGTDHHQRHPADCVAAGFCYDEVAQACHAKACVEADASAATAPRLARFEAPPLGSRFDAGSYEVHVRFPRRRAAGVVARRMATQLPITIRHAQGTTALTIDSSAMADGAWHPLGTYTFSAAVNLALHKSAVQSSDFAGGAAAKAVDGVAHGGVFEAGSGGACAHTGPGLGGWWRVDLGAVYTVEEVVVVGARLAGGNQITGVRYDVLNNGVGACRGASGVDDIGTEGVDFTRSSVSSASDCRDACSAAADCLAYEFGASNTNDCELWTTLPEFASTHSNYVCAVKDTSGATRSAYDASTGLDVLVGNDILTDNGNSNPACGTGNLFASGATVTASCGASGAGLSGRYVNVRARGDAGVAICEVRVYGADTGVAGHVTLSTAGADGLVIADAIRFRPLAETTRSTCGGDGLATVSFPTLSSPTNLYGVVGTQIAFDVQTSDPNPLDVPEVFVIGTPTPNATFVKLDAVAAAATVAYEQGLQMEIFKNSARSRDEQCNCEEFGTILGDPLVFRAPNIDYPSMDYNLMAGLAQYGLTKASHGDHIQIRWTGHIRVPVSGTYTFWIKSDDCGLVRINNVDVVSDLSCHAPRERSATVTLQRGRFPFWASFSERDGRAGFVLKWAGPTWSKRVVPASAFSDALVDFSTQYLGCVSSARPAAQSSTQLIEQRHGICLDASQRSTHGGRVHMWPCNAANKNQMWRYDRSIGRIKNPHGLCLSTADNQNNGGRVEMATCDSSSDRQQWVYDQASGQI